MVAKYAAYLKVIAEVIEFATEQFEKVKPKEPKKDVKA